MLQRAVVRGIVSMKVPTKRFRILIVDDHRLIRDGLTAMLSHKDDLQVCREASDADTAINSNCQTEP